MMEKYFGEINIGSKKTAEEMMGEPPSPEAEETPEQKEWRMIRESYAEQFRTPEGGSYRRNLASIAGALTLAGLTVFGSPEKAVAPEVSVQRLVADDLRYLDINKDPDRAIEELPAGINPKTKEAYKDAIRSIIRRGGIEESPQLPETVYKNTSFATLVENFSKGNDPYFKKPEIVLGEEFIRENPEKAKEYMEKINQTIKASVIVKIGGAVSGSGIIINTAKGKTILTNSHVAKDHPVVAIVFPNGDSEIGVVDAEDESRDLATVGLYLGERFKDPQNIPDNIRQSAVDTILEKHKAGSLDVDGDPNVQNYSRGEKVATVGNPMGFPFETSIGELIRVHYKPVNEKNDQLVRIFVSKPDERFRKLAVFERSEDRSRQTKGEGIGGMSGGGMISLEKDGPAKLLGLHTYGYVQGDDERPNAYMGDVSAPEIMEFLRENKYMPPKTPDQDTVSGADIF